MPIDVDRLHRSLGERIRGLREDAGDSQGDLADALGLSRTSVVNVEAGRQRPPLATLYRIAKRYHTDVPSLLPPLSDVDETEVEARLIEAAVGSEGRARDVLSSFVREVKTDYRPKTP